MATLQYSLDPGAKLLTVSNIRNNLAHSRVKLLPGQAAASLIRLCESDPASARPASMQMQAQIFVRCGHDCNGCGHTVLQALGGRLQEKLQDCGVKTGPLG